MTGYVLRRLWQSAVVLIGVSILVFAIMHLVPGDPVRQALGTRATEAAYQAMRERAGLDEPLLTQYLDWIGSAFTGDLGVSFRTGRPVMEMILERVPATVSLAAAAIVVALLIAIPLGTIAALKPRSPVDWFATASSQAGLSIPDFWMGIMLILLFAGTLGWFPSGGYVGLTSDPVGWAHHLVMPAVTAGVASGSILTRFVRSSVLEALGQDHVRTARAKGMRRRDVLGWHVLRNALIPLVTVGGVQLAYLLSGVVIVEIVFAWPGLGQMALQAVESRDYPLLQGSVLLFAVIFLLVNLLVDLLYARLDPRISYVGAAK
ncbi:ABC transporter permease [Actinobacteria bacterium YIM 96077]|uniref:Glutathione ABC transporter permease GsiC n=1 Tax=Phytoactinopolyspora halophila TaxID=1981511 RepID=A0A329QVL9_9ACTN|nr:ABC transporter permease [Phytoactinopolyspora halophila]AYY12742.1 ABC transporter permease [Actinobacteria bacterium YIM 96077]RAW16464.1 glutathione ABC transporter permease GsiC [Phytoactinopolyspora halophila]